MKGYKDSSGFTYPYIGPKTLKSILTSLCIRFDDWIACISLIPVAVFCFTCITIFPILAFYHDNNWWFAPIFILVPTKFTIFYKLFLCLVEPKK